ncbi:helix-turn-helix domain-containing protein [Sphingomonas sp. MA1305]|uniref:helix-turn-helix domain-containing protein n=1 Tax=Sphingomonas sp. MA1305 TaxID=2479204 RepID=UPI0018DF3A8D|nr:helix-turn-helix domain-containing protein [Sphingomonas sp. MA1305]
MAHRSLAERRRTLGLSQTELAARLGISQAAVSRAENEDRSDKRYALALEALELRAQIGAAA